MAGWNAGCAHEVRVVVEHGHAYLPCSAINGQRLRDVDPLRQRFRAPILAQVDVNGLGANGFRRPVGSGFGYEYGKLCLVTLAPFLCKGITRRVHPDEW